MYIIIDELDGYLSRSGNHYSRNFNHIRFLGNGHLGFFGSYYDIYQIDRHTVVAGDVYDHIPEDMREEAAEFIYRIQNWLPFGNFEIDANNGSVFYKIPTSLSIETLNHESFRHIVEDLCLAVLIGSAGLDIICDDEWNFNDALEIAQVTYADQKELIDSNRLKRGDGMKKESDILPETDAPSHTYH